MALGDILRWRRGTVRVRSSKAFLTTIAINVSVWGKRFPGIHVLLLLKVLLMGIVHVLIGMVVLRGRHKMLTVLLLVWWLLGIIRRWGLLLLLLIIGLLMLRWWVLLTVRVEGKVFM